MALHSSDRLQVLFCLADALEVIQRVREGLDAVPGILLVKYTAQTGSVLVEYEPAGAMPIRRDDEEPELLEIDDEAMLGLRPLNPEDGPSTQPG